MWNYTYWSKALLIAAILREERKVGWNGNQLAGDLHQFTEIERHWRKCCKNATININLIRKSSRKNKVFYYSCALAIRSRDCTYPAPKNPSNKQQLLWQQLDRWYLIFWWEQAPFAVRRFSRGTPPASKAYRATVTEMIKLSKWI